MSSWHGQVWNEHRGPEETLGLLRCSRSVGAALGSRASLARQSSEVSVAPVTVPLRDLRNSIPTAELLAGRTILLALTVRRARIAVLARVAHSITALRTRWAAIHTAVRGILRPFTDLIPAAVAHLRIAAAESTFCTAAIATRNCPRLAQVTAAKAPVCWAVLFTVAILLTRYAVLAAPRLTHAIAAGRCSSTRDAVGAVGARLAALTHAVSVA